jgi:large subunit ribosomal protein L9
MLALQDFHIDRRKIHLDEPIKQLGEHKIAIRLHTGVTAEITVNVVKEAE